MHFRGADGPKGEVKNCEGQGEVSFSDAVGMARHAFVNEMFRMGFLVSTKPGKLNVRRRGRGKKEEGFSMTWTSHYEGRGIL
jgi:hypothetical protein